MRAGELALPEPVTQHHQLVVGTAHHFVVVRHAAGERRHAECSKESRRDESRLEPLRLALTGQIDAAAIRLIEPSAQIREHGSLRPPVVEIQR